MDDIVIQSPGFVGMLSPRLYPMQFTDNNYDDIPPFCLDDTEEERSCDSSSPSLDSQFPSLSLQEGNGLLYVPNTSVLFIDFIQTLNTTEPRLLIVKKKKKKNQDTKIRVIAPLIHQDEFQIIKTHNYRYYENEKLYSIRTQTFMFVRSKYVMTFFVAVDIGRVVDTVSNVSRLIGQLHYPTEKIKINQVGNLLTIRGLQKLLEHPRMTAHPLYCNWLRNNFLS